MCRVDGGTGHPAGCLDQGLLQKVRKGRGTRVALTAAHSSAVAEECIRVARRLHATPEWGASVNDYACLKLSLVTEIVAEIPILQMQLEGSGGGGKEAEEDLVAIICPVLPRVRPDNEGGGVAEDAVLPPPLK